MTPDLFQPTDPMPMLIDPEAGLPALTLAACVGFAVAIWLLTVLG